MENKSALFRWLLLFLLAVIAFIGIATVRSLDLLRFRAEKIVEDLAKLETKIEALEEKLSSVRTVSSAPLEKAGAEMASNDDSPIANRQFFDQQAQPGGRLIGAVTADTKNMNSIVNNEAFVSSIWDYAFDSVAERNFEHPERFEPKLAESWTLSEDKMSYTIKLRKGVLWHDFTDPVSGKTWKDVEVVADDFKFYVDVIKNADVDCDPMRSYLLDLDRIELVSSHEFKAVWKKPYFLSESITLSLIPLPRHLYHSYEGPFDGKRFNDDHERNRMLVGCGPYRFEKWDKDQRIVLKKWDKYYGAKLGVMPPLDSIVFEIIKDTNTQFQSLLAARLDRISLLPEQWVKRTDIPEFGKNNGFLDKFKYPGRSYSYMGYNLKNPLFTDKKVRQALTHLVDRERILNEVYYGLGRICTGPFFMDTSYYDSKIKPLPFSVETAVRLLAEAGWKDKNGDGILEKDGVNFEFTILSVSSSEIQQRMLPIIKEDMAKAGIVMNIRTVEWSVYVQRLESKSFEVCVLGWSMGFESDPYQIWHSSGADAPASSNHISFKNKEADRLIEEIRVSFDIEKRIRLCHEFHQLIHEEQPYTFLISPYSLIAQNRRYRNVRVFPGGIETKIMWVPYAEQLQDSESSPR